MQVVEELWEHYLKFHLKQTEQGQAGLGVKELVGETEYVGVSYDWRGEAGDQQDCIVVSEGDLVAGEEADIRLSRTDLHSTR